MFLLFSAHVLVKAKMFTKHTHKDGRTEGGQTGKQAGRQAGSQTGTLI